MLHFIIGFILGMLLGAWIKDKKTWFDFLDPVFDELS